MSNKTVNEQEFDESELEDIMNEIESLEKDFSDDISDDQNNDLDHLTADDLPNDDNDDNDDESDNQALMNSDTDEEELSGSEYEDLEKELESMSDQFESDDEIEEMAQNGEDISSEEGEQAKEEFGPISDEELEGLYEEVQEVVDHEILKIDEAIEGDPALNKKEQEDFLVKELGGVEKVSEEKRLKVDSSKQVKTSLQEKIEREMSNILDHQKMDETGPEQEVMARPVQQNEGPLPMKKLEMQETQSHGFLGLSVSGNMNVELDFKTQGQTVRLYVTESQGLVIEMDGGVRFTLPLNYKKAA